MQSPEEFWFCFVGILDLSIARLATERLILAKDGGAKKIHLLIQSPGGNVSEGVYLFNFLKSFPVPVHTYNCGNVGSAATIAYLGGHQRIASENSAFLIHRSKAAPGNVGGAEQMNAAARSLAIDDARIMAIVNAELTLTPDQTGVIAATDLTLDAKEALAAGLVHQFGHFCPSGILVSI